MFNALVFQYPIRIPERFALVIRSLLTQEGICMSLEPDFKFLEVAYPYIAKRLLTDDDPALRERLLQMLFRDGKFQWKRCENLLALAKDAGGQKLDMSDTLIDGTRFLLSSQSDAESFRLQLLNAFTEDGRLHLDEVASIANLMENELSPSKVLQTIATDFPSLSRKALLQWSEDVLKDPARKSP
mmetsp:Transcript_1126/g.3962  ORF Transcript_1126/g.3962 Transcript_1126/m.3962 type:complete len:185 (+) Transcript_1126:1692-2246(+)